MAQNTSPAAFASSFAVAVAVANAVDAEAAFTAALAAYEAVPLPHGGCCPEAAKYAAALAARDSEAEAASRAIEAHKALWGEL